MQTTATLFESELTKLINARIEHLKTEISAGTIDDIAIYKQKSGMIDGMRATIDLMVEARENVDKRTRG